MKKGKGKGKKSKRVTVIFKPQGLKALTKKPFAKSFRSDFTATKAILGLKNADYKLVSKRKSKGFRFSATLKALRKKF